MKTRLTIVFFLTILIANAQSYSGYLSDNYSGVHGVLLNPASIANSPMRTDVNLFSISTSLGNNYIGVGLNDLLEFTNFDIEQNADKNSLSNNQFFTGTDALLPSFMFNINSKNSIAVFSRFRILANIAKIDGELVDALRNDFQIDRNINAEKINPKMAAHGWGEIGVTYARVFIDKKKHFFKGGVSLKYLLGMGSGYISGEDVNVNYNATNETIETKGKLVYSFSKTMNNFINDGVENSDLKVDSKGFGADIGFIYEWRPDSLKTRANNYKLKIGVSVTDMGKIEYKNVKNTTYNLNKSTPVTVGNYQQASSLEDFLDKNFTKEEVSENISTALPTMLHFTVDWNINNQYYLNIHTDLALKNSENKNTTTMPSSIALIPRFERKWLGLYCPISYNSYKQFTWGAGFRLGPLHIGSSTILSNVLSKKSKEVNVYIGLKIPIYKAFSRS